MTELILLACPGCGMPSPFITLVNPNHIWYARLIVIMAITIIPLLAAFRIIIFGKWRARKPSRLLTISLIIALTIIFLMGFGPTGSFGGILCFWLFLPLSIICMMLLSLCWDFGILLLPAYIIVIPLYMYCLLKLLFRIDRKFCWRWSRKGRRLRRIKQYRSTIMTGKGEN